MLSVVPSGSAFDGMAFYAPTVGWKKSGNGNDPRADLKWHFIAGTFDGVTLKYYVDGVLVASNAAGSGWPTAPLLPSSTTSTHIGTYQLDGLYFDGYLKNVRIYNRALSQGELRQLMSEPWRPFAQVRAGLTRAVAAGFAIAGVAATTPAIVAGKALALARSVATTPASLRSMAVSMARTVATTLARTRAFAAEFLRGVSTTPANLSAKAAAFTRAVATTPPAIAARAVSLARTASTTPAKVVAYARGIFRTASTTPAVQAAAKAIAVTRTAATTPVRAVVRAVALARLASTSPATIGAAVLQSAVDIALFAAGRVARLVRNLRSAIISADARNSKE